MIFKKLFGDPNEKEVKKLRPIVDKVNSLEESVSKLTDAKIKARVAEIREKVQKKIEKDSRFRGNDKKGSGNDPRTITTHLRNATDGQEYGASSGTDKKAVKKKINNIL